MLAAISILFLALFSSEFIVMTLLNVLGPEAGASLLVILLNASIASLIGILTVSLLMRWKVIPLPVQGAGLTVQIKVGVLVFLTEILVMQFLIVSSFQIPYWQTALLDALLLASLASLLLYSLVLRPLEDESDELKKSSRLRFQSTTITNLIVFFALALTILMFLVLSYQQQFEQVEEATIAQELASQNILSTIITEEITSLASDVQVLSKLQLSGEFLHTGNEQSKQLLKDLYMLKVQHQPLYAQLRTLDSDGMERIRVDRPHGGHSFFVTEDELQDKSGRYYFREGMAKGKSDFYISPLDLNIEHGRIEEPFRPMIRVAAPVFLGQQKMGVVVANINAQHFIDTLAEFSGQDHGERWLLNSEGYWLYTPETGKRWGFMFDARKSQTLARQQPKLWQRIAVLDQGAFTTERGSYIVTRLESDPISKTADKPYWFMVRFLPKAELSAQLSNLRKMMQFSYLATMGLLGLAAWFLNQTLREKRDAEQRILEMAYHDGLTGLINRQRFITQLEHEINRARRGRHHLAVMYMDLNNFKAVNDGLGHEVGDLVLKSAGDLIASSLRDYDTIARVGGDEFSAILSDYEDEADLTEVARRIIDSFSKPLIIGGMNFNIGISIGIAQLDKYDEPVRQLLSRADFAMYEAKQSGSHASFSMAQESETS